MSSRFYQIAEAVVTDYAEGIGYTLTPLTSPGVGWVLSAPAIPPDPTPGPQPLEAPSNGADIIVYLRRRDLENTTGPNRLVIWQEDGSILPPDMPGGGLLSIGEEPHRGNIRRIRQLNFTTEAWFATEEDTENQLHNLIYAWDKATHNTLSFGTETWEDEIEGQSGYLQAGRLVRFETSVRIPVYSKFTPLTEVSAISQTCNLTP